MRSDWLEKYTVDRYHEATAQDTPVSGRFSSTAASESQSPRAAAAVAPLGSPDRTPHA
jgi:hypothetical protein